MILTKLATKWFGDLKDPAAKQKLEGIVKGSSIALTRLNEIVEDSLSSARRQEAKVSDYDTASWSHKQAHRNGYCQAMYEIQELLSFLDKR